MGGIHDSVSVPAYFETFTPYSLSEADNDSSHSFQAVMYPGFFLFAAAQFYGFPQPPGTTETLWPQGPTAHGVEFVPAPAGSFFESRGTSNRDQADGTANVAESDLGQAGKVAVAKTTSSVHADGSGAYASGTVVLHDLSLGEGALTIGAVRARADASASGFTSGAKATSAIDLVDAKLLGVPVVLTSRGLAVGSASSAVPDTAAADALMARAGISIRRLPDTRIAQADGTIARVELGGIEIRFDQPAQEFAATLTLGRARLSVRAERPAGASLPAVTATPVAGEVLAAPLTPDPTLTLGLTVAAPTPRAAAPSRPIAPSFPAVQRVSRTDSAGNGDWSVVALLLALAVGAVAAGRRVVQIVSTP
jgi:hypothetical protein